MELWKTLYSSAPAQQNRRDIGNKKDNAAILAAAIDKSGGSKGNVPSPIDEVVKMEYEFAGEMCFMIDSTMESLRKVSNCVLLL